jgi:hypothetical protein
VCWVTPTGRPAVRPDGFDLAETWAEIEARIDERRATFRTEIAVVPQAVPWLRAGLGTRLVVGETADDGRVRAEVRAYAPESAAGELAGFGDYVEVLGPPEVREHLARLGADLVARYG